MSSKALQRVLAIADEIGPDVKGRYNFGALNQAFLNHGFEPADWSAGLAEGEKAGLFKVHPSGSFFEKP